MKLKLKKVIAQKKNVTASDDFFSHFDNVEFLEANYDDRYLERFELSDAEMHKRYGTDGDAE